jgi:glycosyltransferase involved in cell wall biosynthesis
LNLLKTYNSDKNWLVFHLKQLVGRYVFKKISKTSSHIIVPSQFTKDEYIAFSGIPEEKVTLAYEAADVSTTSPLAYKQPFKDFIMYVGHQADYKNIKRLGDAHQKLLEKHPDLGLILVGRKNAATLQNEAYFDKKEYKNILFTDFIGDPQRDWLFTKCRAYVFPSLMEGFGLPPLEAMGRGAPVISSSATCLPEINGDAAKYFDPTNIDDMAKVIEEVIYDEGIRQDLIKKGFLQIKKYSWRKMAKQTHQVYVDALKN